MKVMIADDHGIVRSGITLLLERQPDIDVVAEASDGQEALKLAIDRRPDVAILDNSMPKLTGLQVCREIKQQAPEINVLILSMHDDERYLYEALRVGAGSAMTASWRSTESSKKRYRMSSNMPMPNVLT